MLTNGFGVWMRLMLVMMIVTPASLTSAQNNQDVRPEFFGIYAKLADGSLVEILEHQPRQYRSFVQRSSSDSTNIFRDNDISRSLGAFSAEPKQYLRGLPEIALRMSEVEGFYVYGDYDLSRFSLVVFQPLRLQPGEVLVGDSNASEIRRGNNYVDTKQGWTLANFRHVEKQPKMYWLQAREPLQVPADQASFLAFRFTASSIMEYGTVRYWPFALAKERYLELLEQSSAHIQAKRFAKGLQAAQESKKLLPSPEADQMIGAAYYQSDRLDEALAVFQAAINDWPDEPIFKTLCGLTYNGLDEFVQAKNYFLQALRAGSRDPSAHRGLAYAYVSLNINLDEAIKHGEQALRSARSPAIKVDARATLAQAYIAQGEFSKARRQYQKALKISPDDFRSLQCKAHAEFAEAKAKPSKKSRKSGPISPAVIVEACLGKWQGTYSVNGQDVSISLVVSNGNRDYPVVAEYEFRRSGIPQAGRFKLAGEINPYTKQIRLAGIEKLTKYPVPYKMSDIYGQLTKDGRTIIWSSPCGVLDLHKSVTHLSRGESD